MLHSHTQQKAWDLEIHSLKPGGGTKVQRVLWAGEAQPERAEEKQTPFASHLLGQLVLNCPPTAGYRVCVYEMLSRWIK